MEGWGERRKTKRVRLCDNGRVFLVSSGMRIARMVMIRIVGISTKKVIVPKMD